MHQVNHHLGISIRTEFVAGSPQFSAQRIMVLDNAVMHQGDFIAGRVRVRVDGIRYAMRRPARMRDAAVTR